MPPRASSNSNRVLFRHCRDRPALTLRLTIDHGEQLDKPPRSVERVLGVILWRNAVTDMAGTPLPPVTKCDNASVATPPPARP